MKWVRTSVSQHSALFNIYGTETRGTIDFYYLVNKQGAPDYVGTLVKCYTLFHQFGMEQQGRLMAALDSILDKSVQALRLMAEHPGVYAFIQGNAFQFMEPSSEMGPGERVTRDVMAGAVAMWELQPTWEYGKTKMMEAVLFCAMYLQNVPAFAELINSNTDFAAAFAKATVATGNPLPPSLTVNAVIFHCKECGQERQLSRSHKVSTFTHKDLLRCSSTMGNDGQGMDFWCAKCVRKLINGNGTQGLHPTTCLVCPQPKPAEAHYQF